MNPQVLAALASGLGAALSSKARGGTLGEGMSQGLMGYDQRQNAVTQRQRDDEIFAMQKQRADAEQAALAHKAEQQKHWESLFAPDMMAGVPRRDDGMRAPVAGGFQTASGQDPMGSAIAGLPENVRAALSGMEPEQGQAALVDWLLKQGEPGDAPKTVGGLQWNAKTGAYEPIPGYTDQQKAIAEAGRTPAQPKTPGIITLHKNGQTQSVFDNDPRVAQMLTDNWVEEKPDSGGGPAKPPSAADLRGEYIKATKDFEQASYGYGKVVQAANDPSPAGDIAMIFGFMKTLDPNSTVREGEFATAQNAGSVPERIAALYNSVVKGTRLTEPQRKDFINQAKGQFSVYQQRKQVADKFYSGLAERNQISPQDVLVPYGDVPQYYPPSSGGPDDRSSPAPTVIDGVTIQRVQ